MTGRGRCAVVAGQDAEGRSGDDATSVFQSSVDAAVSSGVGSFDEVVTVNIAPASGNSSSYAHHEAGAVRARDLDAEWICFLGLGETLSPRAFELVSPAVQSYDAVWGGVHTGNGEPGQKHVEGAGFSCQDTVSFFHAALHWGIGRTHFVRTDMALEAIGGIQATEAWYADYLIRLWHRGECLKSAQPYSSGEPGLFGLNELEKSRLLDYIAENPLFISVDHKGKIAKLPYTGCNPTLERIQLRGLFYEAEDLAYVGERVASGATIVDVGANTGNHLVYFSLYMSPRRIIPIEPNPEAARVLKATIDANGIDGIDLGCIGKAAGAVHRRVSLKPQRRVQLGSVALEKEAGGEIEMVPLDDLIEGRVDFIKIDAEAMELDVLLGGRGIVDRDRPLILVEVQDENLPDFLAVVENFGYRVERIFPDQAYANYFLAPQQLSGNRAATTGPTGRK
ncbi:MAG: FkbM family methyltransferase [Rhodospirillales bacterium]